MRKFLGTLADAVRHLSVEEYVAISVADAMTTTDFDHTVFHCFERCEALEVTKTARG